MFIRLLEVADLLRHYGRRREWADGHAIGRRGEDIAQRFLQRAGITVVARNYHMESGGGEIDLIGWDRDRLVFIEVKTRQTDEFGAPDRAIGPGKQKTMLRAAREYARHAEIPWEQVRFDVVGIILNRPPAITHFRDVLL